MDDFAKLQLIEFAQQFFTIANAITAFSVLQAVALMYGFKDNQLAAAFLRWRPYTSLLSKHAGNGYILAVIGCGIAEFRLRQAAGQPPAMLRACIVAAVLRCTAIFMTSSVFCLVFVAVCREQDWLNKNRKEEREFQIPRVLHKLSGSKKLLHKLAMKVDKRLFGAPLEAVVHAEDFEAQASINPASIYRLGEVTVVSPNEPGWVLLQSNKSLIGFQKRGEGGVLNATVKTIRTKVFDNEKDLLTSLEALKVDELSKLKKDSVHFNYVSFKGSPCVQYDGIFTGDTSAPNFKYFNFKGYLCRHSENKGLVIQIELSSNSNLRGFSENLDDLSKEFFEKMAFSKVDVQ